MSVLGMTFTWPNGVIVAIIEFVLGLGVGYVLAKGLKYIAAFFVLLLVGDLLNIWTVKELNVSSLVSGVTSANITAVEQALRPLLYLAYVVQPIFTSVIIFVGFLVGAAIAMFK